MKNASLAASLAVASLLVLSGSAFGRVPVEDSVVGGGSVDTTSAVSFDVRSGPSGENPSGEVTLRLEPGGAVMASRSIDCLIVNGSTATFAGTWLPNPYGQTHFGFTVEDTGPTASAADLLGLVSTTTASRGCSPYTGVSPLISGGIVVTDAQALPLKTPCLNGGWKTFGVFRNQGDCVSFVASKGMNPGGAGR